MAESRTERLSRLYEEALRAGGGSVLPSEAASIVARAENCQSWAVIEAFAITKGIKQC
jgi:hypothetical protein